MRLFKLLLVNLLLTTIGCGLFGPAATKLDALGLRGWAARAPFYLLPLYLSIAITLWTGLRESYVMSGVLGIMLTVPAAFWVIAAKCPYTEAVAHMTMGLGQGVVLAWLAKSFLERAKAVVARPV
jgi:hypothetical protein